MAAIGGKTPSLISGWPNLAFSDASTMSQAMASSQPPPSAGPLTTATVGIGTSIRRFSRPWKTSIIFTTLSGVWSITSTPEEKVLSPLPVITSTLAVLLSIARSSAVFISSMVAMSSTL
jgi:hypothetical protein